MEKKPSENDVREAAQFLSRERGVSLPEALEFARKHLVESGSMGHAELVAVWNSRRQLKMM
jgi:hypothetical protein